MIYIIENCEGMDGFLEFMPLLSEQRRRQCEKYKFLKDKRSCVLAYLLLRYAAYKEYQMTEIPGIINMNSRFKPEFRTEDESGDRNTRHLNFNFSHCETAVVCGLSKGCIGVDVQEYTEMLSGVRDDFLSENEMNQVNAMRNGMKETARFWTLKEAYGKYYGWGLAYAYQSKDFSEVRDLGTWQLYRRLNVYSGTSKSFALTVFASEEMEVQRVAVEDLKRVMQDLMKRI